jgi:hypothetical protein
VSRVVAPAGVALSAVFFADVADADASPVEPTSDRRVAVPDSDRIVGAPCVRTPGTGKACLVTGIWRGNGWFQLSRWHGPWLPSVLRLPAPVIKMRLRSPATLRGISMSCLLSPVAYAHRLLRLGEVRLPRAARRFTRCRRGPGRYLHATPKPAPDGHGRWCQVAHPSLDTVQVVAQAGTKVLPP